MKLLLFLSALLSALGGAGGARAAQAPVAVSRTLAAVTQVATTQAHLVARPAQRVPSPAHAIAALLSAWSLRPSTPLYAARRRE